jgi:hypothetical protein
MSRNDEEKAVSVVSFISSSLWHIDDFSITDERKITNVTQRKQNSALSQRYRIPNSRERVKSGPRPKTMNKPIKKQSMLFLLFPLFQVLYGILKISR